MDRYCMWPPENHQCRSFVIGSAYVQESGRSLSKHEHEHPLPLQRNAALLALLDQWLADESGFDESIWPELKKSIDESRTSKRKRFSE
jgi:hypothetical protein